MVHPSQIRVVTFHTEGPPQDLGFDFREQANLMREVAQQEGYGFSAYTPTRLVELGAGDLVQRYDDKYAMECNPGAHLIGLYAWKPFVILDSLLQAAPDEIIFYLDSNILKYPQYREKLRRACELVEMAGQVGDFFVAREGAGQQQLVKHYASGPQLRGIGGGSRFCVNFPLLIDNNVVCRKSNLAVEILSEILEYCRQREFIITPTDGDRDPSYKWFVSEQAVLNLVIAKRIERGQLPWFYPGVTIGRGFKPRATDNTHVRNLRHRPSYPVSEAHQNPSWRPFDLALSAWKRAHGTRLTMTRAGDLLLGDDENTDFHLVRAEAPEFKDALVRLQIVARPLPDCDVALHIQHWGGQDIVSFDRTGAVVVMPNAVSATSEPLEEGLIRYEAIFVNKHHTVSFGLGDPGGWYPGRNRDHFLICAVELEYSPLTH